MEENKLSKKEKLEKATKTLLKIRESAKDLDISFEEITEIVEQVREEKYLKKFKIKTNINPFEQRFTGFSFKKRNRIFSFIQ